MVNMYQNKSLYLHKYLGFLIYLSNGSILKTTMPIFVLKGTLFQFGRISLHETTVDSYLIFWTYSILNNMCAFY